MYDTEKIDDIPIDEVIEKLGGEWRKSKKNMSCFNKSAHKDNDKASSLTVYKDNNICICRVCNVKGGPINIVKNHFNGDFKKACEFLHAEFNIPYKDSDFTPQSNYQKKPKPKTVYWTVDLKAAHRKVALNDWLSKFKEMSSKQKTKMVYTFIYRFSLTTDQSKKTDWYKNRQLGDSKYLNLIGFLSVADIKVLEKKLTKYFPIEILRELKVLRDAKYEGDERAIWRYGYRDMSVVPSFDLYSDLVDGLVVRIFDKDTNTKEFAINKPDILYPVPFGLGRKTLKNCSTIWLSEGHTDGMTVQLNSEDCFTSFTGVYGWTKEMLGLFRGKNIIIAFDQDAPGQRAILDLIIELLKVGAKVEIATWDDQYGEDLNDVHKNSFWNKIIITKPVINTYNKVKYLALPLTTK